MNRLRLITAILLGLITLFLNDLYAQTDPFSSCNFGTSLDIGVTIAGIEGRELINPLGLPTQGKETEDTLIIPPILPQTVDYGTLIQPDTQVFIFGETHTSAATKDELANNMDIFKKAGITHLGMEMFGTDVQGMLDEYSQGGSNEDEIRNYLREKWGYEGAVDNYMNMIAADRDAGISIVALDTPGHAGDIEERNDHMVSVVEDILRNDNGAKIITLTGTMHIQANGEGMRNILSSHFINVGSAVILAEDSRKDPSQWLTTTLLGSTNSEALYRPKEYYQNLSILDQIAREGLSSQRFSSPHTDFYGIVIHLP